MRRSEPQSLGQILKRLTEGEEWSKLTEDKQILSEWDKMVGSIIADATERVRLKEGTLYITMRSSVAREELRPHLQELKQAINRKQKREAVKKIFLN